MRTPAPPALAPRPGRADEVVAAARLVLERDGADGLTMRSVAEVLHIKAPSLYKHVASKGAIEVELITVALREMGESLHAAIAASGGPDDPPEDGDGSSGRGRAERRIGALLAAYRCHALRHPNLYRLATAGRLPRHELPPGLEDWAGEPFTAVAGGPHGGQALWSFAHGMVVLELDDRYPDGSELEATWAHGAAAFAGLVAGDPAAGAPG
jgi:AcrR family transcriptional regulator